MSNYSRQLLFNKLNPHTYRAFEAATTFCKLRGNQWVEWSHLLSQLTQNPNNDLVTIFKHFGVDEARLSGGLVGHLDSLPKGGDGIADFADELLSTLEQSWSIASLKFDSHQIRSGYLLLAWLESRARKSVRVSGPYSELLKIDADILCDQFDHIVKSSCESVASPESKAIRQADGQTSPLQSRSLERFTVDMVGLAKAGHYDNITGREDEIALLIDVLMRRRQNNPVLTGEAGVGKTAVVEGFAQKIAQGEVPPELAEVKLLSLDLGLLQAGASLKGEFEQRLKEVIEQVQDSLVPIILFIDELHTLVGAGGQAGVGDAANLLKPALARGTLRTIGATTWDEYRKHIEKDPALGRRFQVVKVEEPDTCKAIAMLDAIVPVLEKHHQVLIRHEAIKAAVELSARYLPDRQLPDKAVSLLDTACARVKLSQHSVPLTITRLRANLEKLQTQKVALQRECQLGLQHSEATYVDESLAEAQLSLQQAETLWNESLSGLSSIKHLISTSDEALSSGTSYEEAKLQLLAAQGDNPIVKVDVDQATVAEVLEDWTGIPVGKMQASEIHSVMQLAQLLDKRVIGQNQALDAIAQRVINSRAGLDNPDKPVGVFLLAGTSGVGKTETAVALSDILYGGANNLITINMSEYQEAHSVASLKGAPPGYVGYGEGGVLTDAVRRRPHSVILLDEVEKAHPDVHEIFFKYLIRAGWKTVKADELIFATVLSC